MNADMRGVAELRSRNDSHGFQGQNLANKDVESFSPLILELNLDLFTG
jgi:hypothetical protein